MITLLRRLFKFRSLDGWDFDAERCKNIVFSYFFHVVLNQCLSRSKLNIIKLGFYFLTIIVLSKVRADKKYAHEKIICQNSMMKNFKLLGQSLLEITIILQTNKETKWRLCRRSKRFRITILIYFMHNNNVLKYSIQIVKHPV